MRLIPFPFLLFLFAAVLFAPSPASADIEEIGRIDNVVGNSANSPRFVLMDPGGQYAYLPFVRSGHGLVRVRLNGGSGPGGMEVLNTAFLPETVGFGIFSAVIDPAGTFAYLGTDVDSPKLYKINLSTMAVVGTLDLIANRGGARGSAINPAGTELYVMQTRGSSNFGLVVRVRLSDFTITGQVQVSGVATNSLHVSISPDGQFGYFPIGQGTSTNFNAGARNGVNRVNLSTMAVDRFLELDWEPMSAQVSPDGTRVFIGRVGGGTVTIRLAVTNTQLQVLQSLDNDGGRPVVFHPDGIHFYSAARQVVQKRRRDNLSLVESFNTGKEILDMRLPPGSNPPHLYTSHSFGPDFMKIQLLEPLPSAPTITAAQPGNGLAVVTFTAPGSDGGSPITNYQYSSNGGASWTAFSPAVTSSPVTITGLTNGVQQSLVLRAVNANGAGEASNTVNVTPRAPSTLTSTVEVLPASLVADGLGTAAVTIRLFDASGVALTFGGPSVGTLALPAPPAQQGSFGPLADQGNGTFTATYTVGTLTGSFPLTPTLNGTAFTNSATVTLVPGPATQLVLTTQPAGGPSGQVLSTQPVVEIRDANGNRVTSATTAVSVAIESGANGTLGGTTTVNAIGGVATFTDLTLAGTVGVDYVLRFTADGLTEVDSGAFGITFGTPAQLAFTSSTDDLASGSTRDLTVEVRDAQGNLVENDSGRSITFSQSSGAGTVNGLDTVETAAGGALLPILGVLVGSITIDATSAGLTTANTTFTLIPGPPFSMTVSSQPQTTVAGQIFNPAPAVTVRDAAGNTVVAGYPVTVTLPPNRPSFLSGTLTRDTDASGVATFEDLVIGEADQGFQMEFTLGSN